MYDRPKLPEVRTRTREELNTLASGVRRRLNPHPYPAGLAGPLHEHRERLIEDAMRVETTHSGHPTPVAPDGWA